MTTPRSWDDSYTEELPPPWDIGRPQPAFARLAEQGLLTGHVLDAGCGTGEHVLLAATHGAADAMGMDLSPTAIERARGKAADRGIEARFEVADALNLDLPPDSVTTVIDSGLFHTFSDEDRPRYVASLAPVLQPGGRVYLMCFSEREPGDMGPRRVRQEELRAAFADGWTFESITADTLDVIRLFPGNQTQAWLAVIART
jgi:cyclopropane fatty-acyl-phospholipid synthase-like methyltransferase